MQLVLPVPQTPKQFFLRNHKKIKIHASVDLCCWKHFSTLAHNCWTSMHSKNKWKTASISLQCSHSMGLSIPLFLWLSQLIILLSDNNLRKNCTLGVIFKDHIAERKIGLTPLKLTKTYKDMDVHIPLDSYCQLKAYSSTRTIDLTMASNSNHCISSALKVLLKVHLICLPSQTSTTTLPCSLTKEI